jgi:hypothetical protein
MKNSQNDLKESLGKTSSLQTLFERRAALLNELEALDDEIQAFATVLPAAQAKRKGRRKVAERQLHFRFEDEEGNG